MKKDSKVTKEDINALYEAILSLKTKEECEAFFTDLCTINEVENMAQRMKAAQLLMEDMTYTQVTALTDVSSATLSRISRCIQYGTGYRNILKEKKREKQ